MNKLLQQAFFVIPILAVIAAPAVLQMKNKSDHPEVADVGTASTVTTNYNTTPFSHSSSLSLSSGNKQDYSMLEPFAEDFPIGFSHAMQQSMNPAAWMRLMTHMMNPALMTQMMSQMTMAPMQMMMPMMTSGVGMNPHMIHPAIPSTSVPQVMNPQQYEEWYKKQQELMQQKKK